MGTGRSLLASLLPSGATAESFVGWVATYGCEAIARNWNLLVADYIEEEANVDGLNSNRFAFQCFRDGSGLVAMWLTRTSYFCSSYSKLASVLLLSPREWLEE